MILVLDTGQFCYQQCYHLHLPSHDLLVDVVLLVRPVARIGTTCGVTSKTCVARIGTVLMNTLWTYLLKVKVYSRGRMDLA